MRTTKSPLTVRLPFSNSGSPFASGSITTSGSSRPVTRVIRSQAVSRLSPRCNSGLPWRYAEEMLRRYVSFVPSCSTNRVQKSLHRENSSRDRSSRSVPSVL